MTDESVKELKKTNIARTFAPWDSNPNVIWLASTLTLHRNIEKFKFPKRLEIEKRKHVLSLLTKALLDSNMLKKPLAIKAEALSALEKNFLLEHFLIFDGFQEAHEGEAFVVDTSGEFFALLNLKDHIQLQLTDTSGDLEMCSARLIQLEEKLGQTCSFAFSPKFGFLTADPLICGTGLVISAYLHIPALIHLNLLQDLQEKERNEAILCTGMQGNPEELIGDILMVRNCYTIGVSEETILSTMRNAILKFVVAEKSARSKILQEVTSSIKDKISRALGVLNYSFQLDTREALSALSHLKLGVELGLVKNISVQEMNRLFFTIRRAHLAFSLKEKAPIAQDTLAASRAAFVKEYVKDAVLDFKNPK